LNTGSIACRSSVSAAIQPHLLSWFAFPYYNNSTEVDAIFTSAYPEQSDLSVSHKSTGCTHWVQPALIMLIQEWLSRSKEFTLCLGRRED
jgi:hypothetical protein